MSANSGVVDAEALRQFDTPTICNALELIDPERRRYGYTIENVMCINADAGPRVGVALTATMRSAGVPLLHGKALKDERLQYYKYMSEDEGIPKVCVMQDIDGRDAGRGPFWGEFNTSVHRSLGFAAIVTDGSVRDVDKLPDDILIVARGLRPSHCYVHIVDFGNQVNVFGMTVNPGDIVHADEHGAVSFPRSIAAEVVVKAVEFVESEAPMIAACKRGRLTFEEVAELYTSRRAIGEQPDVDLAREAEAPEPV